MDQLLEALARGDHETPPTATAAEVAATEATIGRSPPPSYRQFVTTFSNGAYLFMREEVSRVGARDSGRSRIPAWIWDAMSADPRGIAPIDSGGAVRVAALVPFHYDSNGNSWCFLTSLRCDRGEYPVAYYDSHGKNLYGRLESFAAWLRLVVESEDELIRELYGDDVTLDTLGLG